MAEKKRKKEEESFVNTHVTREVCHVLAPPQDKYRRDSGKRRRVLHLIPLIVTNETDF